jgi:hypothetical protein
MNESGKTKEEFFRQPAATLLPPARKPGVLYRIEHGLPDLFGRNHNRILFCRADYD